MGFSLRLGGLQIVLFYVAKWKVYLNVLQFHARMGGEKTPLTLLCVEFGHCQDWFFWPRGLYWPLWKALWKRVWGRE